LSRKDPLKIHACWAAYATEPSTARCPEVMDIYQQNHRKWRIDGSDTLNDQDQKKTPLTLPMIEERKADFPQPTGPQIPINSPYNQSKLNVSQILTRRKQHKNAY
jgi:hypothetical protein